VGNGINLWLFSPIHQGKGFPPEVRRGKAFPLGRDGGKHRLGPDGWPRVGAFGILPPPRRRGASPTASVSPPPPTNFLGIRSQFFWRRIQISQIIFLASKDQGLFFGALKPLPSCQTSISSQGVRSSISQFIAKRAPVNSMTYPSVIGSRVPFKQEKAPRLLLTIRGLGRLRQYQRARSSLCRRLQYTHTPPNRGQAPLPPSLPPPPGSPLLVGLILACLIPSQTPL